MMAFQTFLKCVKLLHSFITSKVFELASSDCAQIVGIFNAVPDLIVFLNLVTAKRKYYAKYDCYSYEQDSKCLLNTIKNKQINNENMLILLSVLVSHHFAFF